MLVLYDFARAPSPRRARILLAEKGIAHETRIVDLADAKVRQQQHAGIEIVRSKRCCKSLALWIPCSFQ